MYLLLDYSWYDVFVCIVYPGTSLGVTIEMLSCYSLSFNAFGDRSVLSFFSYVVNIILGFWFTVSPRGPGDSFLYCVADYYKFPYLSILVNLECGLKVAVSFD